MSDKPESFAATPADLPPNFGDISDIRIEHPCCGAQCGGGPSSERLNRERIAALVAALKGAQGIVCTFECVWLGPDRIDHAPVCQRITGALAAEEKRRGA